MTDSPTGTALLPTPPTSYDAATPAASADPDVLARLARPGTRPSTRSTRRLVLRSLDVVKGLVLGTVITIGATAHVQADTATAPPAPVPQVDHELERLMADHRCTTTGFPEGSIPTSTLVRLPDGHLRVVSFDRGWAAYQGTAPGELVAVCLGPRERD